MIRRIKYLLIIILALVVYDSHAQNSQVLYHMNLPQRHFLNPALRSTNSVYIGLPGISGIDININNNFINFSDVFMNSGDSVISILHPDYDLGDFMKKIKDVNAIEPQVMVQLFGLGFSAGNDLYVFLDINERVEANFALPGDLLRLGFLGNEQFVGNRMDLSSLRSDMMVYHEIGIGFSKNIIDNLRLGIKGKLLFGVGNISFDNKSLGITVNEDYTHIFDADLTINSAGLNPADIATAPLTEMFSGFLSNLFDMDPFYSTDSLFVSLLNMKNSGFSTDIGAQYNLSDKFEISASITDLGFIKWKSNVNNLKAKNRFEFSGLDMWDVYAGNISFDSLAIQMVDSLENSFTVDQDHKPYTTYLPFGVSVGGNYKLTKKFSVGLLSYTRFIGKQVKEALTLSANVNLGNAFSTTLAYTAANHQYDNLGLGLAFRGGWFQFYFLADRIPVTWNTIKSSDFNIPKPISTIFGENSIPIPSSWNTIHFRLGFNLVFGNNVKKKADKPMVVVQQELEE